MKKRPEEGDIYRGKNLTPILDQRVWPVKVIFTPFQAVQWSLISVTWCGELLQLSSNTCGCVCPHTGVDEEMTLLNSCQVLKSLACTDFWWQLNWWSIEQVSSPAGPSGRPSTRACRASRRLKITFMGQTLWSKIGVKFFPLYISPSSGLFFISPDEDLLFEVETSWVKLLCKFQCWRSELN